MRVITPKTVRQFWARPDGRRCEQPLRIWLKGVKRADWKNWGGVRADFGSADRVGNCVVFNVAGNHCRVATRIIFKTHTVYILAVMTHAEYDDQAGWQASCGCHNPPPPEATRRGGKKRSS